MALGDGRLLGEERLAPAYALQEQSFSQTAEGRRNLMSKARWICEQTQEQMKEELGLDHFEGRSWQGLASAS